MAGTTNKESRVEISKPLKTTVPMLIRLAEPVPLATSRGRNPAKEVIAVKTMGRIRSSAAFVIASRRGRPALSPLIGKFHNQNPVLCGQTHEHEKAHLAVNV